MEKKKVKRLTKQPFQLIIDRDNQDGEEAVLNLRWCLHPNTIPWLKEKLGVQYPYMLLVVANQYGDPKFPELRKEQRLLVPLGQGQTYIEFSCPGTFVIWGSIVWADPEHDKKRITSWSYLHRRYLETKGDRYTRPLTDGRATFQSTYRDSQTISHYEEIKWEVNKESFAKEPPAWLKWWVNLWFKNDARDQCSFRRRCMLAFSIKPILIFPWITLKAVICFLYAIPLLIIGWRADFRPIIHPFCYVISDVKNRGFYYCLDDEECYFTKTKKDGRTPHSVLWEALTTPWHWLACAALPAVIILLYFRWGNIVPVAIASCLGSILLLAAIIIIILKILSKTVWKHGFEKWLEERKEKEKAREEEEGTLESATYYEEKIAPLSCDLAKDRLPDSHKTFRLRWKKLKTRVCKQFAR